MQESHAPRWHGAAAVDLNTMACGMAVGVAVEEDKMAYPAAAPGADKDTAEDVAAGSTLDKAVRLQRVRFDVHCTDPNCHQEPRCDAPLILRAMYGERCTAIIRGKWRHRNRDESINKWTELQTRQLLNCAHN